jgi:hypothetical protein
MIAGVLLFEVSLLLSDYIGVTQGLHSSGRSAVVEDDICDWRQVSSDVLPGSPLAAFGVGANVYTDLPCLDRDLHRPLAKN